MTLSEFNERTNAHLTEDQYKPVENMYNEAGNIQKDRFCADWKKHNDSVLLQEFFAQSERLKGKVDGYRNQINEIAIYILEQAEICSAPTLREKAIQMLGIETYLRIKIQKGYNLWQKDLDALVEILSKTK